MLTLCSVFGVSKSQLSIETQYAAAFISLPHEVHIKEAPHWRALNPTPHVSSLLKQKLKKLKHNIQQQESKSFGYTRIQNPILLNLLLGREVIQWMVIAEKKQEGMRLGRYELGRTLGEGNFGKVKFAQDLDSGLPFAVKILEKNRIIHLKITDQVFPSFILLFYCFPFFSSSFFSKKKKTTTTTTILLILFSFSWVLSLGCLFTSYGLCLPAACCLLPANNDNNINRFCFLLHLGIVLFAIHMGFFFSSQLWLQPNLVVTESWFIHDSVMFSVLFCLQS